MEQISLNEYLDLYLDESYHKTSNLANFAAVVMEMIPHLNWVGFYLYNGQELYLGPFQGKAAVQTIPLGEGVCGVSAKKQETLVVDDVHQFEGHIACDDASNSEVVIPIIIKDQLFGVLDIDSPLKNRFDQATLKTLKEGLNLLIESISK